MQDLSKLEEILFVSFRNKELLRQALTHRSFLNENPGAGLQHNERLEFLGDAVIELAVTEALYERYPEKPEGEMTSFRAALVNAKMLSDVATRLNLNDFLLLSRGEAKDTGRARQYILANAFEAVVGALYLDQGYEACKIFLEKSVLVHLEKVVAERLYKDSKSLFQEEAQDRVGITPTYEVLKEWGPDHDKHFVVGVFLGKELIADGEGQSKQAAQAEAAQNALQLKQWHSGS